MSNNFYEFEAKQTPCSLVVFGSYNFQLKNIYFEHLAEDNQLYEDIIAKSISAIGKENIWHNDSLDGLYLQIERLQPFTEIILVGHSYNDSIILGDELLLSFYDEKLKLAITLKSCRVFMFTCFQQSVKELPPYFGQINYLSDYIYRTNMHMSLTSSEMEKFDELRLGAEFDDCLRVLSNNSNIHEYISGHTIARFINEKIDSQEIIYEVDTSWGPEPTRPFVFTPVHSDWNLFQEHYQNIIGALEEHCGDHLNGNWLLTQCLWGQSLETGSPVILLLFDSKKESWSSPKCLCQSLKLIEIKDEINYHASFPKYTKKVNSSCVIGNSDLLGTLGGYLAKEDGEVAGLTCGHVCGIRYGEQFTSTIIQQPPESSLNKFIQDFGGSWNLYIPSNSELPCGTVMNGEVYCESKFHHHYDWALIKMNLNRVGTNCFPLDPFGESFGNASSVQPVVLGDLVWKHGYATEITYGNIDTYCSCNIGGIVSKEFKIVFPKSSSAPFSESGDSGSFVLKKDDNDSIGICGMVIAGSKIGGISVISPMEILLKRINDRTGEKWQLMHFTTTQTQNRCFLQ